MDDCLAADSDCAMFIQAIKEGNNELAMSADTGFKLVIKCYWFESYSVYAQFVREKIDELLNNRKYMFIMLDHANTGQLITEEFYWFVKITE